MKQEYSNSHRHKRSLFWPLLLVAAGIFLMLNTMGYFPGSTWQMLLSLWPLLFIVGGLDNLYQRESFVGPIFSIGIGLIFLLTNLGYIQSEGWRLLIQFWPVLLIALGLDLIIGHRTVVSAIVGVLVGVALLAGVVWLATNGNNILGAYEVRTETVNQLLGDARSADVNISATVGELNVSAGKEKGTLAAGTIKLANSERLSTHYSVENDTADYQISSEGLFYFIPFVGQTAQTGWNIQLSPTVPMELDTKMVTGEQTVDLQNMNVVKMNAETVMGKTEVILPKKGEITVRASAVIGSVVIRVPKGAEVDILVDTAITSVNFPDEYEKTGSVIRSPHGEHDAAKIDLKIEVPIGSVSIEEY